MTQAQQFHLTIYSEFSYLGAVAEFIAQATGAAGMDAKSVYNVQMAVDEAVTNVIEHAYHGQTNGRIEISCEQRGDEFIVEIEDEGKPFDASRVPTPRVKGPLSGRRIGGLGVFFMKKLMDQVEFTSRPEGGNRVRMVKRIR